MIIPWTAVKNNTNSYGTMYFIAENTKYKFKRNDSLDRKFVATIIYRTRKL